MYLLKLLTELTRQVKAKRHTAALFLDLQKAFDTSGTLVKNTEVELCSVFYWKLRNRSVIAIYKLILAGQGSLQVLQPWQRSPAHN